MNPRELVACAESAMMTAKARGKSRIVLFEGHGAERPGARRARGARRPLDRPPEDAPERRRQAEPAERREGDRRGDRERAADARSTTTTAASTSSTATSSSRSPSRATSSRRRRRRGLTCTSRRRASPATSRRPASRCSSPTRCDCEYARHDPGHGATSTSRVIAVPLRYGARVIGVVVVSKLGVGQFDEDDAAAARGARRLRVGRARERAAVRGPAPRGRAREGLARDRRRAPRLQPPARTRRVAWTRCCGAPSDLAARLLGAPRVSVWLQDRAGEDLAARASTASNRATRQVRRASPAASVATHVPRGGRAVRAPGGAASRSTEPGARPRPHRGRAAPLDGERLGCIVVATAATRAGSTSAACASSRRRAPGASSPSRTRGASRASRDVPLDGRGARERARGERRVHLVPRALDHRHGAHVGGELGIDAKALKRLELGALFHDIGKIGIPAAILAKPGPLTDEERTVDRAAPGAGRADPRADRAAGGGLPDRPPLPRALGRHRLSRTARRRGDPARVARSSSSATPTTR